uniref:Uncharacterized protein n=1 Tax=Arion vulgaris TaxID=1028688 RepID=A0A0B7A9S2_9EUPU
MSNPDLMVYVQPVAEDYIPEYTSAHTKEAQQHTSETCHHCLQRPDVVIIMVLL